jgi:hemerythrin-like domain-containing protein
MSPDQKDQGNVTVLPTAKTSEFSNQTPTKPDRSPAHQKGTDSERSSRAADFSIPGSFSDASVERVAKRLCEHMNLNHNLCCQLEHIADGLPDSVDKQECLYVARSIIPVVKLAHEFEENVLFPLLRENFEGKKELEQTLDRLQGEHWEDESYASEVHQGLLNFVGGLAESNVESLAYMLRGFFEGMRRHLAFEREHVLPLLRQLDAAT